MKKFEVDWAEPAAKDLENILDHISEDSVDNAISVFKKIKSKCTNLYEFPERGRVVPELKEFGILSYPELIASSWRIIYRITGQKVYVLAVIDSRRNMEEILIERFL